MFKKLTILFLVLVLFVISFDLLLAQESDEEYVFVAYVTSIPYWKDGLRGWDAAGEQLGVKTSFVGPVEFDAQAQARVINECIAKKVAGILISPADPNVIIESCERAMKAGIPVVLANCVVNSEDAYYAFLGSDNYNVGVVGGAKAAEILNGKGKVAILTMPGVLVHEQRKTGYLETFAKYPDIEVVAIADTKADPSVGLEKAAGIIQANPDLGLIVGTDSVGGAAAARAVLEAGKKGEIHIIGMDRDVDILNFIKDGTVDASLASESFITKFMALHYLYWIKHDMMKPVTANTSWRDANVPPVPRVTDTGTMVIDKNNVDLFLNQ
jgi:ribose transport system substrate-binding protein